MEYNVEPKRLPRNVEMERKRRTYKNLKIEDALKAEGVKPYDMLPPEKIRPLLFYEEKYDLYARANYLPLEIFDDEEYDCRCEIHYYVIIFSLLLRRLIHYLKCTSNFEWFSQYICKTYRIKLRIASCIN